MAQKVNEDAFAKHDRVSDEDHKNFATYMSNLGVVTDKEASDALSKFERILIMLARKSKREELKTLLSKVPGIDPTMLGVITEVLIGKFAVAQPKADDFRLLMKTLQAQLERLAQLGRGDASDELDEKNESLFANQAVSYFAVAESKISINQKVFRDYKQRYLESKVTAGQKKQLIEPGTDVMKFLSRVIDECLLSRKAMVLSDLKIDFDVKELKSKLSESVFREVENLVDIMLDKRDDLDDLECYTMDWCSRLATSGGDLFFEVYQSCANLKLKTIEDIIVYHTVKQFAPGSRLILDADCTVTDLRVLKKNVDDMLIARAQLFVLASVFLEKEYQQGGDQLSEQLACSFEKLEVDLSNRTKKYLHLRRVEKLSASNVISSGSGKIVVDPSQLNQPVPFHVTRSLYLCDATFGVGAVDNDGLLDDLTDRLLTKLSSNDVSFGYIIPIDGDDKALTIRILAEMSFKHPNVLPDSITAVCEELQIAKGKAWKCTEKTFEWKQLRCGPWRKMCVLKPEDEVSISEVDWRSYPYNATHDLLSERMSLNSDSSTISEIGCMVERALAALEKSSDEAGK